MSAFPTTILGRPARIERTAHDAYAIDVAHDGHEHQWITHADDPDEYHGHRVTWTLAAYVPSGWLPVATGRADTVEQAVRDCSNYRLADNLDHYGEAAACRYCGGTWHVVTHEADEYDECPHVHRDATGKVTA